MNISVCTKHFESLGFSVHGRIVFGIYQDYPMFIQMQGSSSTVSSLMIRILLSETINKKLRKEFRMYFGRRCQIHTIGQTVQATTRTPKKDSMAEYESILQDLVAFLKEHSLGGSEQCPICGQSLCDSTAFYNGSYQKVHANCIAAAMEHITSKAEQNELNGNYLLGILGALLGGLIGIIPNLLTIWFTETIYSLLYALIPICIYWGYRLFKGVINKSAIIVTLVFSILYLFVMEFLLSVLDVYISTNGLLLIRECWQAFTDPLIFKEIVSGMISSFLFLLLGLIYCWRMISETNTNIHSNAEFTMSTVMPLHRPVPKVSSDNETV